LGLFAVLVAVALVSVYLAIVSVLVRDSQSKQETRSSAVLVGFRDKAEDTVWVVECCWSNTN
jgi:hypothetical protein